MFCQLLETLMGGEGGAGRGWRPRAAWGGVVGKEGTAPVQGGKELHATNEMCRPKVTAKVTCS